MEPEIFKQTQNSEKNFNSFVNRIQFGSMNIKKHRNLYK